MDITTTGVHYGQQLPPGTPVVIEVSGDFNGVTATIGFKDGSDGFAPYALQGTATPTTLTDTGMSELVHVPASGLVGVSLSGAPTLLILKVTPVADELQRR